MLEKQHEGFVVQIHRIPEWSRWEGTSGSNPMLSQGHPEPVAQNHVQMAFEDLQRWRLIPWLLSMLKRPHHHSET